jgi:hypothetical protein
MKNIKTVEVIKALPGLEVGDTLTRKSSEFNFELDVETVGDVNGDPYTAQRFISLSAPLINKDEFKAIEWFTPKVVYNKSKAFELEKEVDFLKEQVSITYKKYDKLMTNIESKITEFNSKLEKEKEFTNSEYKRTGYLPEYAGEATTVYTNMISLLKAILA